MALVIGREVSQRIPITANALPPSLRYLASHPSSYRTIPSVPLPIVPCLLYLLTVMQCLNSGEHDVGAGGLRWQSPPSVTDDDEDDELQIEHLIDSTSVHMRKNYI